MNIRLLAALFITSSIIAGNFNESYPSIFKAYATLAGIKAIDEHVKTLELLKKDMEKWGNYSESNNLATIYHAHYQKIVTRPTEIIGLGNLCKIYNDYTKSRDTVVSLVKIMPRIYKEICLFDEKDLICAGSGIASIKAVLPIVSTSIELLAAIVRDIEAYQAGQSEELFNKIINSSAPLFTVESIAKSVTEHAQHADILTKLYKENVEIMKNWKEAANTHLREQIISLKTTNPWWSHVSSERFSKNPLISPSSDSL
jgi:hypothetical protein